MSDTTRRFLEIINKQAARALNGAERPGYLQLSRLWPGTDDFASSRFRIGDVDAMLNQALVDDGSGFNVYIEGRTIAETAPKKGRGEFKDTRGVFALIVDSDGDKGKGAQIDGASLVIESSPGD